MAKDFGQAMDKGYMIPTGIAVGDGSATDIRCQCDTVADFKTFATSSEFDIRYEGLVTYEKTNKRLMVYKGNDTWEAVGGGSDVNPSDYVTLDILNDITGGKTLRYVTKEEHAKLLNGETVLIESIGKEEVYDEEKVYAITNAPDTDVTDLKLTGSKLELINKDGVVIGNGVTLPTGGGSSVTVEDNLTSTSATNALSAAQGKVLDNKITVLNTKVDNHISNHPGGSLSEWEGKVWNALGDSLTEVNHHTDKQYHSFAKDILGFSKVNNYGLSGSTIARKNESDNSAMVERYKKMDLGADLITVMGGINDLGFNTPLGVFDDTSELTFYGAMHSLCRGLISKYPSKYILFITPAKQYAFFASPNTVGCTSTDYANAMIQVCNFYGIPVMDNHRFSGIYSVIIESKLAFTTDGLHWNRNGHEMVGKKVAKCLQYGSMLSTLEFKDTYTPSNVPVTGVSLDRDNITLQIGASETMVAIIAPSHATNKKIIWSSSNNTIANVSNGTVTALSGGNCIITATTEDGNKTATCNITVTSNNYEYRKFTGASINVADSQLNDSMDSLVNIIDGNTVYDATNNKNNHLGVYNVSTQKYDISIFSSNGDALSSSSTVSIEKPLLHAPKNSTNPAILESMSWDSSVGEYIIDKKMGHAICNIDIANTGAYNGDAIWFYPTFADRKTGNYYGITYSDFKFVEWNNKPSSGANVQVPTFTAYGDTTRFFFPTSIFTTYEQIKEWIAEREIDMYYELALPQKVNTGIKEKISAKTYPSRTKIDIKSSNNVLCSNCEVLIPFRV